MKRLFSVAGLAIVAVLLFASAAGAQVTQEYGEGSDCPPDEAGAPCPFPPDPSANIDPLIAADPFWVGIGESEGGGLAVFAQVGEEDRLGPAVGRFSVAIGDDGHLLKVFSEDYTGGNILANTGETTNEFFAVNGVCLSGTTDRCDASQDNPHDAGLLTLF